MEENAAIHDQGVGTHDLQKSWVNLLMEALLLLVHRLPYPPNKGDKIRSFHLLRYLSSRYDVFLATFIDDPLDWKYIETVEKFCTQLIVRPLKPSIQKIKSLSGFLTGKALTLEYYKNNDIQAWCDDVIQKHSIRKTVVFSSSMAQYVESEKCRDMVRIIDFVDIDSDKWLQYSASMKWPGSLVYRREAKKLLEYECLITEKFNSSLFVSEDESEMFKKLCPRMVDKVGHYNNGVDYQYFTPDSDSKNPYANEKVIVFTGAMDYWANVHAVQWFVKKVFPLIQKKIPGVLFYIVGSNPAEDVQKLAGNQVRVTGRVEDIRPYLQYASIVVAPLQIARGVQNKVLEALSMKKRVIATTCAAEGLVREGLADILTVNDNPGDFAQACISWLMADGISVNNAGREYVEKYYNWESNLSVFNNPI